MIACVKPIGHKHVSEKYLKASYLCKFCENLPAYQGFPYWGDWGESLHQTRICWPRPPSLRPTPQLHLEKSPLQISYLLNNNFNVIFML